MRTCVLNCPVDDVCLARLLPDAFLRETRKIALQLSLFRALAS